MFRYSHLCSERAIRELCARRFQVKQLEDQLFATESYCSQVSAFLVTYNVLKSQGQSEASIKIIMDALLKNVVDNLNQVTAAPAHLDFPSRSHLLIFFTPQDLSAITETKIWQQVEDIDKQSNVAWTDDDPSHAWVKTFIESQPPLEPDHETSAMAKSMLVRMEVAAPEKGEARIN